MSKLTKIQIDISQIEIPKLTFPHLKVPNTLQHTDSHDSNETAQRIEQSFLQGQQIEPYHFETDLKLHDTTSTKRHPNPNKSMKTDESV